jgi:hypothetical protein
MALCMGLLSLETLCPVGLWPRWEALRRRFSGLCQPTIELTQTRLFPCPHIPSHGLNVTPLSLQTSTHVKLPPSRHHAENARDWCLPRTRLLPTNTPDNTSLRAFAVAASNNARTTSNTRPPPTRRLHPLPQLPGTGINTVHHGALHWNPREPRISGGIVGALTWASQLQAS